MAEIRKHRPRTSSIGDQVRASVDSGPRPVIPGEDFDPFVDESDETADATEPDTVGFAVTGLAATDVGTSGWLSLDTNALQALLATSLGAAAPADADDDDLDDEFDDDADFDDEDDDDLDVEDGNA